MGNKTNSTTLRPNFNSSISNSSINQTLYAISFLQHLDFLFLKKNIFLADSNLLLVQNKIFLTLFVFFRIAKFIKLSKKYPKRTVSTKNFSSIFKAFTFFKVNLLIYTVINLNFQIKKNKKLILLFYKNLKKEGLILFPRRFRFFLDFIQISVLFLKQQVKAKFLLKNIVDIFRMLQKKLHSKFLNFISFYLKLLVLKSAKIWQSQVPKLKGLKFIISGKLKGKSRSTKYTHISGSIPIQTISRNIEYAKNHAFTIYGVFGFKLWIYQ